MGRFLLLLATAMAAACVIALPASATDDGEVKLCHHPGPGQKTITRSDPAQIAHHLDHGDYLGRCQPYVLPGDGEGNTEPSVLAPAVVPETPREVYCDPSGNTFDLEVDQNLEAPYDSAGLVGANWLEGLGVSCGPTTGYVNTGTWTDGGGNHRFPAELADEPGVAAYPYWAKA
jgi:hypothetical protein